MLEITKLKTYFMCGVILFFLTSLFVFPVSTKKVEKLYKQCQEGNKAACEKLIDLAKNEKNMEIRILSQKKILECKNLINQELLTYILKNDKYKIGHTSKLIIKIIDDQKIWLDLAKNAKDKHVRLIGLKKISADKQQIFAWIAKNDEYWRIRVDAVNKLNQNEWQGLLEEIVKNDISWEVRRTAVKKITDQKLLIWIVKNDNDDRVRTIVVDKIDQNTYQDLLADIAKNDTSWAVREKAVKKLDSEKWHDLLVKIAKNEDENGFVRTSAEERLKQKLITNEVNNK